MYEKATMMHESEISDSGYSPRQWQDTVLGPLIVKKTAKWIWFRFMSCKKIGSWNNTQSNYPHPVKVLKHSDLDGDSKCYVDTSFNNLSKNIIVERRWSFLISPWRLGMFKPVT